jgi:hypothetical protein
MGKWLKQIQEWIMDQTYKAILRGDRLEWSEEPPIHIDTLLGIEVYVTIPRQPSTTSDGKAMAEALTKLAAVGHLSTVANPSIKRE